MRGRRVGTVLGTRGGEWLLREGVQRLYGLRGRAVQSHRGFAFLACENAENLRVLHERIVGELPKRDQSVVEAANEVLEVVEEMQGMLEGVRKLSDTFKVRDEISDVHEALENLWVALGGIDASEEDRRLGG